MIGAGRPRLLDARRYLAPLLGGPLHWLILAWVLGLAPVAVLTASVFGALPAVCTIVVMMSPLVFLWVLNRRSVARIRGLNPPASDRTQASGPANRPTSGPRG